MNPSIKPTELCPPDCPDRSATCHSECEKYLKYHGKQRVEYERRAKAQDMGNYLRDSQKRCKRTPPIIEQRRKKWRET